MTMSVTYTTVGGMILHENRGGTERYYRPDTLGSVASMVDSSGTQTDSRKYWPYGSVRQSSGAGQSTFAFVGSRGYMSDGELSYVRARHYSFANAAWVTTDPLWPRVLPISYGVRPVDRIDPTGLNPACVVLCGGCLICLAGFLWACDWCETTECRVECLKNVYDDLPGWAKFLCGALCAGCLACLLRPVLPPIRIGPPRPPPGEPAPIGPGPIRPPLPVSPSPSLPVPYNPGCLRAAGCAAMCVGICVWLEIQKPPPPNPIECANCIKICYSRCVGATPVLMPTAL